MKNLCITLCKDKDKEQGAKYLQMAVHHFARVTKPGGVLIRIAAACENAAQEALQTQLQSDVSWTEIRDGSVYMTIMMENYLHGNEAMNDSISTAVSLPLVAAVVRLVAVSNIDLTSGTCPKTEEIVLRQSSHARL